jgi:hypothetical protein
MNNLSKASLYLVVILMLTACVSTPTDEIDSTEQLRASPPPDWNLIYQLNNINSRLTEFVPQNELTSTWSTKLSFESFHELADIDPIQVLLTEVEQDKKNCSFIQHFNLYSGLENNYPSSVRLFLCGENSETENGEVKIIKVIQGKDYLYVITLLKKIDPFEPNEPQFEEEEIAAWSTYLRGISLCDDEDISHRCPTANP